VPQHRTPIPGVRPVSYGILQNVGEWSRVQQFDCQTQGNFKLRRIVLDHDSSVIWVPATFLDFTVLMRGLHLGILTPLGIRQASLALKLKYQFTRAANSSPPGWILFMNRLMQGKATMADLSLGRCLEPNFDPSNACRKTITNFDIAHGCSGINF
jgi:hypothetical protein